MGSTNRKRALLISSALILLCFTIIAGMSWALFTDTETLNHHLKAGDLDITLIRTNLITKTLDNESGFLVEAEYPADVNFTNSNNNLFDLTDDSLIVPCSEYIAEMQIKNNSDVAFRYWLELDFKGGSGVLANQLRVTVTTNDGQVKETWLRNGFLVGSENEPISILAKGGAEMFTVKVEFVDDRLPDTDFINNDAMNDDAKFDVVIHAVQEINAPTSPK